VIAIAFDANILLLAVLAVSLVIAARTAALVAPLPALQPLQSLGRLALPRLVRGGLRGGILVALALSLPDTPLRTPILAATYAIVMFSVIVQGGSVGALIRRLTAQQAAGQAAA
jgi:CPA1 family monovalent cation:H+ antiporter